jgi:hypothetical protein
MSAHPWRFLAYDIKERCKAETNFMHRSWKEGGGRHMLDHPPFGQDNETAFWGYLVVALGFLIVAFSYKKTYCN